MSFFDRFKRKKQELAVRTNAPTKGVVTSVAASIAESDKKEAVGGAAVVTRSTGAANRLLLYPLTTEKSAAQAAGGQYVFAVSQMANKIEIRRAVENVYGVKVRAVNLLNYPGKAVNYGRYPGRRKNWRKAVVTLAKGQRLELYSKV